MNCKKCGTPLESSWKICPNCGTTTGVQKSARHKKKSAYKNGWLWVVILLLIIVLGLAAYIGILSKKGTKDENKTEPKKDEKAVTDFSGIDMEILFGQSEDYAVEIGLENSEGNPTYIGLDGSVQAVYQEGNLINIVIQGSGEEMPSFHGVRTGMTKEEAVEKMKDVYPEIVDSGESIQFMNLDAKRNVVCGLNENNVASINISIMSDEEIGNYRQAKEEQMRAQYIFPDSNSRYLSEEEVRAVETDRLFIGRNELFARHGYIFQDEGLQQHFNSMPWYSGTVTAEQFNADAVFNDFEKKNAELIKRIEDEINGAAAQDAEKQAAIDNAYNAVVGRRFHKGDSQLLVEFTASGEFIAIGYYGSNPLTNKYCTYSFSAEYVLHRDVWQYLVSVNVEGVDYYFRYFNDGGISLEGNGEFSAWYEPM